MIFFSVVHLPFVDHTKIKYNLCTISKMHEVLGSYKPNLIVKFVHIAIVFGVFFLTTYLEMC